MSFVVGGGVVGAGRGLGGSSWSGGVAGRCCPLLLGSASNGSVSESASNELCSVRGERGCV